MTVIVWDGHTLAADKRMSDNGYPATTTKIFRAPNGALLGGSGDSDAVSALRRWYCDGADRTEYPNNRDGDTCCGRLLVITPEGKVTMYLRGPDPLLIEDRMYAMGSGGDFALAAMHLGHDARHAVEVACALDTDCGNGIDTLTLEKQE
jgi:hypothetical protein